VWPVALGFALIHALAFVLFVLWAAPRSTRVTAQAGVPAVDASELRARLCSLADAGLGCELGATEQLDQVVLKYLSGEQARSHVFTLTLDTARRTVFVHEQERAAGAAPRDAEEANMRPMGSFGIDLTPDAKSIYSITNSATYIDLPRLAALDVQLDGPRVRFPQAPEHALDAKHVAYALAAVVTRSGHDYQPILLKSQRGVKIQ
jgi:hypothetical protein